MSNQNIKKATRHVNQNEGLIFERSSPGKKGYRLAPLDVPEVDYKAVLGSAARERMRPRIAMIAPIVPNGLSAGSGMKYGRDAGTR